MKEFEFTDIDELIHGKIRLGIMTLLNTLEEAEFGYIRDVLKTTDGNLSVHLRKLEEAKYIQIKKSFVKRKPLTVCKATKKGVHAFAEYLKNMEKLLYGKIE